MLCTVFAKEIPISNVWNLKVDGLDSNGRFTETNQEKKKLPGAKVDNFNEAKFCLKEQGVAA
jgi:hypothetical protein